MMDLKLFVEGEGTEKPTLTVDKADFIAKIALNSMVDAFYEGNEKYLSTLISAYAENESPNGRLIFSQICNLLGLSKENAVA